MALVPFPGPQSEAHPTPPEDDDDTAGAKMSFLEHLDEFRKRLVNSLIGVLVGVGAGFLFIDRIFDFVFAGHHSVTDKSPDRSEYLA